MTNTQLLCVHVNRFVGATKILDKIGRAALNWPTAGNRWSAHRSRKSAHLSFCGGGTPRWSSVNLEIDNHFLEFSATSLAHLVHRERLRTLTPNLVDQIFLRVLRVRESVALAKDERSFDHILQFTNIPRPGIGPMPVVRRNRRTRRHSREMNCYNFCLTPS
jgi:hypothetical protein